MSSINQFSFKKIFSADYIFLFAVTLFIRFPFFFRDYIDRDESTFILIGNTVAEGFLPYDRLWDLKPPLLFYMFGLVEYIAPHSLIAIRLFGVIIIFLSAFFLVQITKTIKLKNGFLIAFLYILLSSLFDSIQCVMSEHVAVFFFLPGLLLFLKNKSSFQFFFAGFLFGCSLLCKLNLAYPVLALILYYVYFYFKQDGFKKVFTRSFFLSTGILTPFFIIIIPYLLKNKLKLFIESVFMASFEYGNASLVSSGHKLAVAWWIIMIGLLVSFLAIKKATSESKKYSYLFAILLMSTIFTFYTSGTVNGHYLVEIYPLLLLLVFGYIVKKEFVFGYLKYSLMALLLSVQSLFEYYKIFDQYYKKATFYNGKAFETIDVLKKHQLENKKIFFGDYHIGYWFLHKYPLTKSTTHPSSLSRPAFFKHFGNNNNSIQELMYIMEEIKPEVIVSRRENLSFFPETSPENLYFINRTNTYYDLFYQNTEERIFIWKKKEN